MHNTYVDRGIIKWAPFDALVGYHTILSDMRYRMGKAAQPVLSDDQLLELNQNLMLAYKLNIEIEVTYFSDGYLKATFGNVKKIDWIKKFIVLSSFEKINACDILRIELINQ